MVETLLWMQQIPAQVHAGCTKGRFAFTGVSPAGAALSTLLRSFLQL